MKYVVLFAAVVIAGAVRQPGEGAVALSDDDADRIVENGQGQFLDEAEDDAGEASGQLEDMTVAQLKDLAAAKSIDLGDAVKKADIIALIEKPSPDA